jgi:hypothetical protein
MKSKHFLAILLISFATSSFSIPLRLSKYISEHLDWKTSDQAAFSYITNRCGLLYTVISERYKNMSDAADIYNNSVQQALIFIVASKDSFEKNGGSSDAFEERAAKWAKIYGEEAVKNIDLSGEMITGDFKEDITSCSSLVLPALQ